MRLVLNIPAFRLDLFEHGMRVRSFRVAVGMRKYQTPTGDFEVTRVTWNPWWLPPDSPWARDEHVTPPGPSNPMGRVKLQLRGLYFLHGTPLEESIGRAASHGCIRMHNNDAIELATRVQAHVGRPIGSETVDTLTTLTRETRIVDLPVAVPLRITYDLVEIHDDTLFLFPNVYSRSVESVVTLAHAALTARGADLTHLDSAVISRLALRSRRKAVAVPLDSVFRTEPATGTPPLTPAPVVNSISRSQSPLSCSPLSLR